MRGQTRKKEPLGKSSGSADCGVPRGIRTPDLLVRSQSLYPAELWALFLLRTVVLTTIAIISHLLQLVKRFFEFFSGFSKKVCIARNFGVFCLGE